MSSQSQTSSASGGSPRRRQPGWWFPFIYVAAFLVVIAVNGTMVYFAMSTDAGLETENHYIKGIRYNAALEGARRQEARGWRVELDFQSPETRRAQINLTLSDRDGAPLRGAQAVLRAVRPVAKGHDFDIPLTPQGDGRLVGEAEFPLSGVWDVKVRIDHPDGDYQDVKRVWVK